MTKKLPITADDVIVTKVELKPEARKRLERHIGKLVEAEFYSGVDISEETMPTLIQIVEENLNALASGSPAMVREGDNGAGFSDEQLRLAIAVAENMTAPLCGTFMGVACNSYLEGVAEARKAQAAHRLPNLLPKKARNDNNQAA